MNNREILVNKDNPIPKCFDTGNLVAPFEKYKEHLLNEEASRNLVKLIEYIDGEDMIIPTSGYRSISKQREIYLLSILKNGIKHTKKYVAYEGQSEHHTGLAIDLGLNINHPDIESSSFRNHKIVDEFLDNMGRFGFILRYGRDKEEYTNISYEPWHFRYVGYPLSRYLIENNLSLEEYYLIKKRKMASNE